MAHINIIVPVPDACDRYSIVTDATGRSLHWIFCITHMQLDLCREDDCELCQKLRYSHGDSTA